MLDLSKIDITKDQVLAELQMRTGSDQGIHVRDLVARITNSTRSSPALERRVRDHIQVLRLANHPICGYPGTGYYMAAERKELRRTAAFLVSRADSTVRQVAAMLGAEAPDLYAAFGLKRPEQAEASQ